MKVELPDKIKRVSDGLIFTLTHWMNFEDHDRGYYYYSSGTPFEELGIGKAIYELNTGLYISVEG